MATPKTTPAEAKAAEEKAQAQAAELEALKAELTQAKEAKAEAVEYARQAAVTHQEDREADQVAFDSLLNEARSGDEPEPEPEVPAGPPKSCWRARKTWPACSLVFDEARAHGYPAAGEIPDDFFADHGDIFPFDEAHAWMLDFPTLFQKRTVGE